MKIPVILNCVAIYGVPRGIAGNFLIIFLMGIIFFVGIFDIEIKQKVYISQKWWEDHRLEYNKQPVKLKLKKW